MRNFLSAITESLRSYFSKMPHVSNICLSEFFPSNTSLNTAINPSRGI